MCHGCAGSSDIHVWILQSNEAPKGQMRSVPANQGQLNSKEQPAQSYNFGQQRVFLPWARNASVTNKILAGSTGRGRGLATDPRLVLHRTGNRRRRRTGYGRWIDALLLDRGGTPMHLLRERSPWGTRGASACEPSRGTRRTSACEPSWGTRRHREASARQRRHESTLGSPGAGRRHRRGRSHHRSCCAHAHARTWRHAHSHARRSRRTHSHAKSWRRTHPHDRTWRHAHS